MGRIVGDGALNFEIVDIAVDPKYHKQGFGRVIMEHIMAYLDKEAPLFLILRIDSNIHNLKIKCSVSNYSSQSEGMYIIK
jgi:GNAT superfamily N-acetyltransferase